MNTNSKIGKSAHHRELIGIKDETIMIEAAMRRGQAISELINPTYPSGMKIDLDIWKNAWLAWKSPVIPMRNPMYLVYDNARLDIDLESVLETRRLKPVQAKFAIIGKDGKPNPEFTKLFQRPWYREFVKLAMKSQEEGYVLMEFFKFKPNGEIDTINEVDKYHVKPNLGTVTRDQWDVAGGYDYLNGPISQYYIPVGDIKELGLLYRAAPFALAKKYALAVWGEYNEKLGIPFRTVTTNTSDSVRSQQLAVIMKNMGAAGWAVINKDEEVKIMANAGHDPIGCFERLIQQLDASKANYILGQSSTSNSANNKGTYGSMKILQDVTDDRHEADLTFIKDLINDILIPRMITWGYKLDGCLFDWDYSVDLPVGDFIDGVAKLESAGFDVDAQQVQDKTGIKINGKKVLALPAPPEPFTKEPAKPAVKKKSKNLTAILNALYSSSCGCSPSAQCSSHQGSPLLFSRRGPVGEVIQAKADPKFEKLTLSVAKKLYEGKKIGIVDIPLLKATATELRKAITTGYVSSIGVDNENRDNEMLNSLHKSATIFSGFKTHAMQLAIADKLKDKEGNLRSFADFKQEVLQINNNYNVNYLSTEYNHCVVSAQWAGQWQNIQANKDTLTMLEFDATLDDRTTEICQAANGTRTLVDDFPYHLPLHFNERSVIRQVNKGPVTKEENIHFSDKIQPFFKNNSAKSGEVFSEAATPYRQGLSKLITKQIIEAASKTFINSDAYEEIYKTENGSVSIHETHNPEEIKSNTKVAKLIADEGHQVKLLPYTYEPGIKNPDASIDNKITDFKTLNEPTHRAIQGAIELASKQLAEIVVITIPKDMETREIVRGMYGALNPEWNKNIKEVWFIKNKKIIRVNRKQINDRTFRGLD